jgi:hypothetical protein
MNPEVAELMPVDRHDSLQELATADLPLIAGGMAIPAVLGIHTVAKNSTGGNSDMSSWACP